ncbi:MAG: FkbM family methyltransferase [Methylophagaceae bacterium]|jgi:FkbM family methyltransferase|tara:strand:- start:1236 stop:1931 length:696 start_codon:yes stop_codon:yes gene_type:complete
MFKPKSLNFEVDTADLSINEVTNLHNIFFVNKDYDWWYEVLPGDVVVDIGASVGMFSAKALDAGAKKVYMIEPSKKLLKTAVKNVSEYIIGNNDLPRVVPINAAVGRTDVDLSNVYGNNEVKLMSLLEFCVDYDVEQIDFLKINAAGAEYNILHRDMFDFLGTKVRHIAVRCYLDAQYGSLDKFKEWRDTVLNPMIELGRVYAQEDSYIEKLQTGQFETLPKNFMLYIKNW